MKKIITLSLLTLQIALANEEIVVPAPANSLFKDLHTSQDLALKQMFPNEECFKQAKELYDSYTKAKETAKKSQFYKEDRKFLCGGTDEGYYHVIKKSDQAEVSHQFYITNGAAQATEDETTHGLVLQEVAPFYKRWWRAIFG